MLVGHDEHEVAGLGPVRRDEPGPLLVVRESSSGESGRPSRRPRPLGRPALTNQATEPLGAEPLGPLGQGVEPARPSEPALTGDARSP